MNIPGQSKMSTSILKVFAFYLCVVVIVTLYVNSKLSSVITHASRSYIITQAQTTAVPDNTTPNFSSESELTRSAGITPLCKCPEMLHDYSTEHIKTQLNKTDPKYNMSGLKSLSQHHPNILLPQFETSSKRCSLRPSVLEISWMNVHWQLLKDKNGTDMLLYSATYDNRTNTLPKGGVVRVLGLTKGIEEMPSCLFWYANRLEPIGAEVVRVEFMTSQETEKFWIPCLLTCAVSPGVLQEANVDSPPVGVSLVFESCAAATNLLKVSGAHAENIGSREYQRPRSLDGLPEVGVCGPALFYYQENFSLRLVEWLEIMKALGVSKVFFYVTDVHPAVENVLHFYENEGFVSVTDFRYPWPYVDESLLRWVWTIIQKKPRGSLEKLYFTDCVLRNMHRYRYLAHFDPDEVPVLLQHPSVPHFLQYLANMHTKERSFALRWKYFPLGVKDDQSVDNLHSLVASSLLNKSQYLNGRREDFYNQMERFFAVLSNDRVLVTDNIKLHQNMKCFYDMSDVTTVMSHNPHTCASGKRCLPPRYILSYSVAFTGHFRDTCQKMECDHLNLTLPLSPIRSLRPRVVPQVLDVLQRLNLLNKF